MLVRQPSVSLPHAVPDAVAHRTESTIRGALRMNVLMHAQVDFILDTANITCARDVRITTSGRAVAEVQPPPGAHTRQRTVKVVMAQGSYGPSGYGPSSYGPK